MLCGNSVQLVPIITHGGWFMHGIALCNAIIPCAVMTLRQNNMLDNCYDSINGSALDHDHFDFEI